MAKNNEKETRKPKRKMSPNSLANLKPFEAGNDGGGRSPGSRNVSTILKEILEQAAPGIIKDTKFVKEFCQNNKGTTNADAVACRILYEALVAGESWAMKELLDRTEGKAKQGIELSGKDGEPIQTLAMTRQEWLADRDKKRAELETRLQTLDDAER